MVRRIATGVTAMTRKKFALIVAVVVFASGAACLSPGLNSPATFPSETLGAEWQCHSTAGIMTTCTRVRQIEPAADSARKDPLCPRRAGSLPRAQFG
jgi:hypothetical protein